MSLTIYNTLTRKKELFEPVTPGKVGIYVCGPTVYKPSHIGHAVGPVIFDAIKRYLVYRGYDVKWVVNITDVEDKLIAEAKKQGTTSAELAKRVTEDYLQAMAKLNVTGIDEMPKASENIDGIIGIIERLIEKGHAYASGGDVYFDVAKDGDYGKLSNRSFDEQSGQRELQSGEKRNSGDFALWKAAKPEEPEEVKFDSPWGKGRPGWHIECSVMSMRYLGETFDIHGGGLDLVFPHHENEIAQSECATGKLFAKYWMHNGLTTFNTKKVAKSDTSEEMQNALKSLTLHVMLDNYPGEVVRYLILSTHYRRPIECSPEEIDSKRKGLSSFYRFFERIERACEVSAYDDASLNEKITDNDLAASCEECLKRFEVAMDDDFNTAGAIATMFELVPKLNRFMDERKVDAGANESAKADALAAARRLVAIGRLIGLFVEPQETTAGGDDLTDQVMQVLMEVRQHVRKNKDFATADLIRDRLKDVGITLEDRPEGTIWRVE